VWIPAAAAAANDRGNNVEQSTTRTHTFVINAHPDRTHSCFACRGR